MQSTSAISTQHMWELLVGNRAAVLPRDARGRQIMGLVYLCFENSDLNCSLHKKKKKMKSRLYIANFREIEVCVFVRSCAQVILRKIYWSYKQT